MVYCAVFGCKNNQNTGIRLFNFPVNKDIKQKWIYACKRADKFNPDTSKICEIHFKDDDYRLKDILLNVPALKKKLKPNTIPTINLPKPSIGKISETSSSSINRAERQIIKDRKVMVDQIISEMKYECNKDDTPTRKPTVNLPKPSIDKISEVPCTSINRPERQIVKEVPCTSINRPERQIVKNKTVMIEAIISEIKCEKYDCDKDDVPIIIARPKYPKYQDKCIQTFKTENLIESYSEFENKRLRRENNLLIKSLDKYKKLAQDLNSIETRLQDFMTTGQIRRLKINKKNGVEWTDKDISEATALHRKGKISYQYLLSKNYPLPSIRTLSRRASKIKLNQKMV